MVNVGFPAFGARDRREPNTRAMLVSCSSCKEVFGKPLVLLDFSGGKEGLCARVPVNLRYQIQTVAQESLGQLRRRRRFSGSLFSQKATNISDPRELYVEDGNGRDSLFLALRFMSESIYVCN